MSSGPGSETEAAGVAPAIEWVRYYDAPGIFQETKREIIMMYFSYDPCEPCELMEDRVFTDPAVVEAVKGFIPVKVRGNIETEMAKRFNIQTFPMIIFARLDSGEIDRKAGYRDSVFLLRWIADVKAGRNTMTRVQKALEGRPDDVDLLLCQARNYLDADEMERSKALAEKAAQIDPKNVNGMILKSLYHLRVGELPEAAAAVGAALEADAGNEEARHLNIAIMLKEAEQLVKKSEYDAASSTFMRVLELDPSNLAAHMGLGQVHREAGAIEKAFDNFRTAQAMRPASAIPHVALGDLFQKLENEAMAEQEYLKAIEVEPRYEPPYFRLMELYEKSGKRNALLETFTRAVPIKPAAAHNEIAWLLATSKSAEIFDPIAAEKHAQAAVELDPEPMYLDTLAEVYYAQGRYDLAIGIIKEAIAAAPEDPDYYQGQLVKFQKARDEALPALKAQ